MAGGFRARVAAVVMLLVWSGSAASSQSEPILEVFGGWVDYMGPPEALPDMVRQSAAIVIARYSGRSGPSYRTRSNDKGVQRKGRRDTSYSFDIEEVLRNDPRLPVDRVEVKLPGGDYDMGTYILRERIADVGLPVSGHRYVVFLKENPNTWELHLSGPMYAYDVTGPFVKSLKDGPDRFDGIERAAFMDAVRSALTQ